MAERIARERGRYAVETVSRKVAIEVENGDKVVISDPDVAAIEFPSWGDVISLGRKIIDLVTTGPTFPVPPKDDGDDTEITIVINGGNNTIVIK